jgi:cytochrome P450
MCAGRMDFGWWITVAPYGEAWRAKRKLMHMHMNQNVVDRYQAIQLRAARQFARDILATPANDPKALPRAVQLSFGQMIMKLVYGLDVPDWESEYIRLPASLVSAFSNAFIPGRYLIDYIPASKHGPIPRHFYTRGRSRKHSEVHSLVVSRCRFPAIRAGDPAEAAPSSRPADRCRQSSDSMYQGPTREHF